ncbi:MAG: hypothetical protein ACI87E_000808 [Mariniblastus sp.]
MTGLGGERRFLKRLFEVEAFTKLYQDRYKALFHEHFTEEKTFTKIDSLEKVLSPLLQETPKEFEGLKMGIDGDSSGTNRAVQRRVYAIKPFVKRRIEAIEFQLNGDAKGATFQAEDGPDSPSSIR